MKKIFLLTLALSMGASIWAETAPETSDVESEGSGFLTSAINNCNGLGSVPKMHPEIGVWTKGH